MLLHTLSSDLPLTKTLTKTTEGLIKTPYPMVRDFTSHEHDVPDLAGFYDVIDAAGRQGHCLSKGALQRPLLNESRAGATATTDPTWWVCLDMDALEAPDVDFALSALGLADVDYIVQYSSSHTLIPGRISAHVFMLLERTLTPPILKSWLTHLNLTYLREQIKLNKLGTALLWPLDITTCQNDKLLYIAPPTFKGMDDPMPAGTRLQAELRTNRAIPLRRLEGIDFLKLETDKRELLHELRKKAGLSKIRDTQYKLMDGHEVLTRPDQANVTAVKVERGFRYFNLNGGDSWAYYQPEHEFKYVFNFKGEPVYLLQELAPDLYANLVATQRAEQRRTVNFFSFNDPYTDTIWNAIHDRQTDTVQLLPCATERKAEIFLKTHGMGVPEELPAMSVVFDPHAAYAVDYDQGVINTYVPPKLHASPRSVPDIPFPIQRVLRSAVGEGDILAAYVKWMQALVVNKCHIGVSWTLHGNPGTGKGVLFNRILTPMVGVENAVLMPAAALTSQFNGWMEGKLLIGVDEAETEALGPNARQFEANMKNWITEPRMMIRGMYRAPRTAPNFANFMLFGNRPGVVRIDPSDRRYQVGQFQANRLVLSEGQLALIDAAVPDMFSWLHQQKPVVIDEVRVIVQSDDRRRMIELNETTIDSVARHLINGDLAFFFQHLPTMTTSVETVETNEYRHALYNITLRAANAPDQGYVTRDELHALMNYLAGNIRRAPHHFVSLLKHHRIYLHTTLPNGRSGSSFHVKWKCEQSWCLEMIQKHLADEARNSQQLKKV